MIINHKDNTYVFIFPRLFTIRWDQANGYLLIGFVDKIGSSNTFEIWSNPNHYLLNTPDLKNFIDKEHGSFKTIKQQR